MADKWVCPNCKTEWDKTPHYEAIVRTQNIINIMSGNPTTITELCGRCNHMEIKKEGKTNE